MHPRESEINELIQELVSVHDKAQMLLCDQDVAQVRFRVQKQLETPIQYLSSLIGSNPATGTINPKPAFKALTKVLGQSLNSENQEEAAAAPTTGSASTETGDKSNPEFDNLTPEQKDLILDRDNFLKGIDTLSNEELIDKYPELTIRAAAKKVGLPVTEKVPEKVDSKTIDQIRAAIKKAEEVKAATGQKAANTAAASAEKK